MAVLQSWLIYFLIYLNLLSNLQDFNEIFANAFGISKDWPKTFIFKLFSCRFTAPLACVVADAPVKMISINQSINSYCFQDQFPRQFTLWPFHIYGCRLRIGCRLLTCHQLTFFLFIHHFVISHFESTRVDLW